MSQLTPFTNTPLFKAVNAKPVGPLILFLYSLQTRIFEFPTGRALVINHVKALKGTNSTAVNRINQAVDLIHQLTPDRAPIIPLC